MLNLPTKIMDILSPFAQAFTAPAWRKALVLLCGAILAPGRRTVAAALRVMGHGDDQHFTNYHRLLNRDQWSPWLLSRLLLAMLIQVFLPDEEAMLQLLIDETLERRQGDQIKYKGWFRDAVRSTANHVTTALGIRWVCVSLLVPVPWSERPWALPFMTVPALSQKTCERLGKRHRSPVEWAELMIAKVRQWQPERLITIVGDGAYAAVSLVRQCQTLDDRTRVVTRLRLDARLFDPPGPQPPSKRGPKPKKGARQPNLAERLVDPATNWQQLKVTWYQQQEKVLEYITGVSLWHTKGQAPVEIRWVLIRCPDDESFEPRAYLCSEVDVTVPDILTWVIGRWNLEVTFEELRAYLGFETQRQWSDKAIERTTPCLFGIFSLVVLIAKVLYPAELPIRQTSWYHKDEATFSDALAAVRMVLWQGENYSRLARDDDPPLIPQSVMQTLLETVCYST